MEILVVIMDHAQTDTTMLTHVPVITDMFHPVEHVSISMNVQQVLATQPKIVPTHLVVMNASVKQGMLNSGIRALM